MPWQPPSAFGDPDSRHARRCWTRSQPARRRASSTPHQARRIVPLVRPVLLDMTEMEARARQIVGQWFESGLLHRTTFDHPDLRPQRAGRAGGQRQRGPRNERAVGGDELRGTARELRAQFSSAPIAMETELRAVQKASN